MEEINLNMSELGKNLAIIGASYLQLPLIIKAKEMGYTTHVFAWASRDVGEYEADYFYPISIVEKELIADKCYEIGICGICSIATDLGAITVNYVANELGLTGNSMECTAKSTNKYLMREAFKFGGDPSPRSVLIDENTDLNSLDLNFPLIVKPTDRSGSRGIYKVKEREELENAVRSAMYESFEKKALIEEFVEGKEYSVEGISYNGKHEILAVTLKYTTGEPFFIEKGHLEPAPIDVYTFNKVKKVVTHALDTLKIKNGASHSEIKIDSDGSIKIIEIGARMGGDCIGSDLVYWSTGIDYVKAVIDVACGKTPNLIADREPQAARAVFIFTEEDKQAFEELERNDPDKILRVVDKHFELIGRTTDSSNRAGCYIVKA